MRKTLIFFFFLTVAFTIQACGETFSQVHVEVIHINQASEIFSAKITKTPPFCTWWVTDDLQVLGHPEWEVWEMRGVKVPRYVIRYRKTNPPKLGQKLILVKL